MLSMKSWQSGTAWLWAATPSVMYWCTRWVWETSLRVLPLAIRSGDAPSGRKRRPSTVIQFGLLWGIAALANTSLLAFLPASGLWAGYRRWKRGKASLTGVVLSGLVFVACIAPWLTRNRRTLGVTSLRFELRRRVAHWEWSGRARNVERISSPPKRLSDAPLSPLGEIAYVAERKREAVAFIREDYPRFLGLCVKRFDLLLGRSSAIVGRSPVLAPVKNSVFPASSVLAFWGVGRALRKRRRGAWLFFWLICSTRRCTTPSSRTRAIAIPSSRSWGF